MRWCICCSNRSGAMAVAVAQLVVAIGSIVLAVVVVTSNVSVQLEELRLNFTAAVTNITKAAIAGATTTATTTTQATASSGGGGEDGFQAKEWVAAFSRNTEAASKASLYSFSALDILGPIALIIGVKQNIILLIILWTVVNIAELIGAGIVLCLLIVLVSLDWSWIADELRRQNVVITDDVRLNLDKIFTVIWTIGIILLIATAIYIVIKIYFLCVVWAARAELNHQNQSDDDDIGYTTNNIDMQTTKRYDTVTFPAGGAATGGGGIRVAPGSSNASIATTTMTTTNRRASVRSAGSSGSKNSSSSSSSQHRHKKLPSAPHS